MGIARDLRLVLGCLLLTPVVAVTQMTGDMSGEQAEHGYNEQQRQSTASANTMSMDKTRTYPKVLVPENHPPASVPFKTHFPGQSIPLDARLSWLERFTGDESFNAKISLNRLRSPSTMDTEHGSAMKPALLQTEEPMVLDELSTDFDATGIVQQIRLEQAKVKLEHGPINRHEMPAMTMLFKVSDPKMLDGLKKGDQIGFDVDNESSGFVISRIVSSPSTTQKNMSNGKMDAVGVIRAVRGVGSDTVKLKIEHGPIEKFNMPGMTMMFALSGEATLGVAKEGTKVEFNIDNTSSGFVITNIRAIEQEKLE